MPLLPSSGYSAQVGGLPLPAGRDHRASMEDPVAAAAGQFSHVAQQQADVFLRQKEEDNSRQVSVGASQIRVDTANDINAAEQSGADLEPIKQRMLDRFSKLGEGLETRKGADHLKFYTANASLMFDEQANRIAVQRAYSTATLGAAELMRNESKIIQDNPGYLPYATDNMRAYVDTFSKLSPERKNAIFDNQKKELNMTAALAGIRSDVKSGKEAVEKGKFDLNPEQYNTALRFADTRENALRTQDALLRADAARIVTEQNSDAYDAHFKDIRKATGSDVMKLEPSIMNDPNLKPETREHLINVMKQRVLELNGEGKAPNYTEYSRLLLAATAKDDDPTKIINTDAIRASLASNGGINSAQAERLMAIVGGQKDENQVKINTKINGLEHRFSTAVDGDLRLAAFTAPQKASITIDYDDRVRDLVSQARAANDPKALHALFDPKDKRYVGSQEFMQQSIDEAYTRQNAALPKIPDLSVLKGADLRADGTQKGLGFLGVLKRPDGKVSSELSIGVNINGKETEIPTLVPTLTKDEVNSLLAAPTSAKVPDAIVEKAVAFARERMKQGKPVFATLEESIPVGTVFLDPSGVRRTMTRNLLDALSKGKR